ncbi:hypothetical protein DFQ12_0967 [Sphingobacterium detergens]|uniref:Uncharacterized protein n=1 Tax=Sphingobacterium detergens TaxID=1145106 RepID=A0A420BHH9_SPHD1|nr:hypothetical protein DFQ12_0967 [Sphingobacterium detergens]
MYLDDICLKLPNRGGYNYTLVIVQLQPDRFYPVLPSCGDPYVFF